MVPDIIGTIFAKKKDFYSRHNSGVGTVMIWATFSSKGKSKLAYISLCSTAEDYKAVLSSYLKPSLRRIGGKKAAFMHDNEPIQKAGTTKTWFQSSEISVLDWCPYSPNLNPIENVWGTHARKVYAEENQFNSVMQLKAAIQKRWNEISNKYLNTLIDSMPKRIWDVIFAHRGLTKY